MNTSRVLPAVCFQNLKKFIRHPSLLLSILGGEVALSKQHVMIELRAAEYIYEQCMKGINEMHLTDTHNIVTEIYSHFSRRSCYHNSFLYGVARWFRPRIVIEAGVHYGASTAFLLSALKLNGVGHLWSVDMPNQTYSYVGRHGECRTHSDLLPAGCDPGFVVPHTIRDRWTLVLGDVRDALPRLIAKLPAVDLFFHDSANTYEIMRFEYEIVWPLLASGGILLSDDIDWNGAFQDFCTSRSLRYSLINSRKGLCTNM